MTKRKKTVPLPSFIIKDLKEDGTPNPLSFNNIWEAINALKVNQDVIAVALDKCIRTIERLENEHHRE